MIARRFWLFQFSLIYVFSTGLPACQILWPDPPDTPPDAADDAVDTQDDSTQVDQGGQDGQVDQDGQDPSVPDGGQDLDTDPGTQDGSIDTQYHDVPLQSRITKVQPMTGIVLWEESWESTAIKDSDEFIQLEYAYVRPETIVKAKSVYDWSTFDAFLDRIASRKHQAIVRFYYVYPGEETAVPQYIKDLPDYQETVGQSENKRTVFPDWTNAELQRFHLEFYQTFAQRYDCDPRLAFLQVGFGLWAEYHIYDGPNTIGEQFPSKEFQKTFFLHLQKHLTELHWSISIDAGDSYYSPFDQEPSLLNIRFGNFDDSFMCEDHAGYNEDMWNVFGYPTRYQTSPHGGELSYYSDYDQQHALDSAGMYGRTYEQLSAKFHITYMIGNDQPDYQTNQRIKEAGLANGYKFRINSFRSSSNHSLVVVENIGIAPIYYDAYVSIDRVRSMQSLKGLAPGQTLECEIFRGGVSPTLRIESDHLLPSQTIQFHADL